MIATHAKRGKCGWMGIPSLHRPSLTEIYDAMRFGKPISIMGNVNRAYRANGQKTLAVAGLMRVTGVVNGIKREDGSGKCWIINICTNDNWNFDIFIRTQ